MMNFNNTNTFNNSFSKWKTSFNVASEDDTNDSKLIVRYDSEPQYPDLYQHVHVDNWLDTGNAYIMMYTSLDDQSTDVLQIPQSEYTYKLLYSIFINQIGEEFLTGPKELDFNRLIGRTGRLTTRKYVGKGGSTFKNLNGFLVDYDEKLDVPQVDEDDGDGETVE